MINLCRPIIKLKKNEKLIRDLLLDEDLERLPPKLIDYLEIKFPLEKGKIFNRIGWDSINTRINIMKQVLDKEISLKVAQLEIKRRKKMKNE